MHYLANSVVPYYVKKLRLSTTKSISARDHDAAVELVKSARLRRRIGDQDWIYCWKRAGGSRPRISNEQVDKYEDIMRRSLDQLSYGDILFCYRMRKYSRDCCSCAWYKAHANGQGCYHTYSVSMESGLTPMKRRTRKGSSSRCDRYIQRRLQQTGDKAFTCVICSQSCQNLPNLVTHMRSKKHSKMTSNLRESLRLADGAFQYGEHTLHVETVPHSIAIHTLIVVTDAKYSYLRVA